jgi:hypothetical protein
MLRMRLREFTGRGEAEAAFGATRRPANREGITDFALILGGSCSGPVTLVKVAPSADLRLSSERDIGGADEHLGGVTEGVNGEETGLNPSDGEETEVVAEKTSLRKSTVLARWGFDITVSLWIRDTLLICYASTWVGFILFLRVRLTPDAGDCLF